MITLKSNGYTTKDFIFLSDVLVKGLNEQYYDCYNIDCEICPYVNACNDIQRLLDHLYKIISTI